MTMMSIKEVAELLGVTTRTVANYKVRGVLPYYQVGRIVRFKKEDVLMHIEKNMRGEMNLNTGRNGKKEN